MTEIYVIRHVQAEGNLYRHMQGHWDGDVTPLGRRQRDALALRFRDIPVDAVYSSDLYRARFTATAITRFHELPVQLDVRLREINVGPWETEPFGNVFYAQPELIERFLHDPERYFQPGAETFHAVQERAASALRDIAEANPGRSVAVTTHGITIRCMLTKLLGIPLNDTQTVPIFHNTGVARLLYEDGRFAVDTINDASHLAPELLPQAADIPALRHVCADPARFRELYCACYADAWRAAHGDLRGFEAESYFAAACEHFRTDPESVMLIYDGDVFAGLVDLDTAHGAHAGYGWISLLYLRPEYRGRGLGVQLLGRATTKYHKLGRGAVRLLVAEENAAARAFYRANEFTELSRMPGLGSMLLLAEKKLRRPGHGDV